MAIYGEREDCLVSIEARL